MNEIKGLLFYNLAHTTIIIALISLFFNPNISIIIMIFASINIMIGFLYYFDLIDKIRRKK